MTGADAGLYASNDDLASTRQDLEDEKDLVFRQLTRHAGEDLPAEVSLAEVEAAS